jgi:hypothetical protein
MQHVTIKITIDPMIAPKMEPMIVGVLSDDGDDCSGEFAKHVTLLERHRKLFPSYLIQCIDHQFTQGTQSQARNCWVIRSEIFSVHEQSWGN